MATDLRQRIEALRPWYHDLELAGVRTAPDHPLGGFLRDLWSTVRHAFPEDLRGARVLDVGCNAGFYSLKLHERGARVTAIDHDPRYVAQARLAADVRGADIDVRQMDVYEVSRLEGAFDYILFMGVFYHLRHPLYALEQVAALVQERVVIQSMVRGAEAELRPAPDYPIDEEEVFRDEGWPAMYFVEHSYAGDPTNWWIPNEAGLSAMIRACGLVVEESHRPGVRFCRPGET